MKLETFFEKFDQFADAPDAVEKMRELVLDLAATGRLLPRKGEWETRSLKSLATKIGSGATPAGGRESYFSKGIPLIRSMNVHFRGFDRTGLVFLSDEQADELSNVTVQANDVLLNITGASIGRVTIAPNEMAGARVNQHVTIIRPTSELFPRFLSMFLASPSVQRMIDDIQVGATRQALTKGMIEQFAVPLPPLAEQKRIVAKVDELMALCDRLALQQQERETRHAALARASLARFADAPTPANLPFLFHPSYAIPPADLRKSILTLAVQGKLVPQDPNDEPAGELLAQIRGDHRVQKKGSKADPSQIAEDELPHEVPFGWCWSCVQELAQANESVTYGILKPVWVEVGVPTVRVTEMKTGLIDVGALPKCDPQRAAKFSKTTLNESDLLVSKDGTIGKTAFVPRELAGGNITQHMLRFAISKRLDRDFVRLCIDAPPCQAWMVGETKGVALQGVNVGDFRRMPLPVPPLAEQRRIVAKVEQLMSLVDALETQLAASRATAANLLSALVAGLTSASANANGAPHASPGQRPGKPSAKPIKG